MADVEQNLTAFDFVIYDYVPASEANLPSVPVPRFSNVHHCFY